MNYSVSYYVWKVSGEMSEKDYFLVGLNSNWEFNIENMKEYDFTEKFKNILIKVLRTREK